MCTTSLHPALRVPGLVLAWLNWGGMRSTGVAETNYKFTRVPVSLAAFLKAVRERRSAFGALSGDNAKDLACCGEEGEEQGGKERGSLEGRKRKRIEEYEAGEEVRRAAKEARREARRKGAERKARLSALAALRECTRELDKRRQEVTRLKAKREEVSGAKSQLMAELKQVGASVQVQVQVQPGRGTNSETQKHHHHCYHNTHLKREEGRGRVEEGILVDVVCKFV